MGADDFAFDDEHEPEPLAGVVPRERGGAHGDEPEDDWAVRNNIERRSSIDRRANADRRTGDRPEISAGKIFPWRWLVGRKN